MGVLDYSQVREFSLELPWKGVVTPIKVQFVYLCQSLRASELGRLLFTPHGDETYWVLKRLNSGHSAIHPWHETEDQLAQLLTSALMEGEGDAFFQRCFELPHEETKCFRHAALGVNSLGLRYEFVNWWATRGDLNLPVTFEEFQAWSNVQIENWLDEQWNDPGSELNFIRRFSSASRRECFDIVVESIDGLKELRQVMRWALQSDPKFIDGLTDWGLEGGWVNRDEGQSLNENDDFLVFLMELTEILIPRFLPLPPPQVLAPPREHIVPDCLETLRQNLHLLEVSVDAPTAHERLEAGLNLRDWLRRNTTAEQFEKIWALMSV